MILAEIKEYLETNKTSSMIELMMHFNTDPDTLREMLEHWIRKDKIRKTKKSVQCGNNCQQCNPLMTEIYEWIEEQDDSL